MRHSILIEILETVDDITVANIQLLFFEAYALEVGRSVKVFDALFELVHHQVRFVLLIYAQQGAEVLMLFGSLLDVHFVELLEELSCRQSFNHSLAGFGLDFLFMDEAFHEVCKKNLVCTQIVDKPIHQSDALVVQNVVVEINLVRLSFWDFEVLDAQRLEDGVDFLIQHVLFIPNFQILLTENLSDRLSFIFCNNLKVD